MTKRIFSSFLALAIFFAVLWIFKFQGLLVLIGIANILGLRELIRLILPKTDETLSQFRMAFRVLMYVEVFALAFLPLEMALVSIVLGMILFVCIAMVELSQSGETSKVNEGISRGILGFFYMGLLPCFAYQIVKLPLGAEWFITLLVMVFSGDTLALLVGKSFGTKKIMPFISPQKSLQGAGAGLIGSAIGGLASHLILVPNASWYQVMTLAVFVGLFAQVGDFFESLLKRVANVKDSGSLMPGHGGILDRIDGVLFAAPIMFFGIHIIRLS